MNSSKPKRLLLFAYFYPPLGGPAVQRPCKTVKYLADYGWETDVITIKDIVYHSRDETLLSECRHHKLIRTPSLDPLFLLDAIRKIFGMNTCKLYLQTKSSHKGLVKRLFPIDDKIGWYPFALKAGRQAVLTNRYAAVMVTCGPFSSILAAGAVAEIAHLPLIIDYRDFWSLDHTHFQPPGILFKLLQNVEKKFLNKANLILIATEYMKQDLIKTFGKHLQEKVMTFYNGWDEADFKDKSRRRQADGKTIITYLGTLYSDRTLTYFLTALEQIEHEFPGKDFEFHLVGNFYPETQLEVENSKIGHKVFFTEQQPHAKAIQIMLDSDILLLIIGGEKNRWVLTGKLFEYLRSGRHIVALAPHNNEAVAILHDCGHDSVCPIDDTAAIKSCLKSLFDKTESDTTDYTLPDGYERSVQVRNLAERLL